MSGFFITLEGGEGSGKTTQAQLLQRALAAAGKTCVLTREPGGSTGAEAIRTLLLTGAGDKWTPVAETLLFQAARVEHAERVIKPVLARGDIVLCDRFVDSTSIYQGIAKGLGTDYIRALHRITLGDLTPHLTLILDVDSALGLQRTTQRTGDETRFENMEIGFHRAVRQGFLALAKAEPQRCKVVDATQPIETIHEDIMNILRTRIAL